jgi:hypothetical protein
MRSAHRAGWAERGGLRRSSRHRGSRGGEGGRIEDRMWMRSVSELCWLWCAVCAVSMSCRRRAIVLLTRDAARAGQGRAHCQSAP